MPNWCENILQIRGPKEKIENIYKACVNNFVKEFPTGLLQSLRPMPKEIEVKAINMDENFFKEENWYNWRIDNWGTKWEATITEHPDIIENENETTIKIKFETAWGPPIEALYFYGIENPEIQIYLEYNETGMQFCGELQLKNKTIEDNCYEYHSETSESVRSLIGTDLDKTFNISNMLKEEEEM